MRKLLFLSFLISFEALSQVQIGSDINGEALNDRSGTAVSLSCDGNIVAISSPTNDDSGLNAGQVRVFELINTDWVQKGNDMNGENASTLSGSSIDLSCDGNNIAIGAPFNDGNGDESGHVRVYDLSGVLSSESFKQNYFTIFPNPVKNKINIELNQGIELKKINIYNALGQFISTTKNLKINISNLTSGIYFIEIETNKGKSAKKIIIE